METKRNNKKDTLAILQNWLMVLALLVAIVGFIALVDGWFVK